MTTRIRNTSLLTLAAVAMCVGSAATANAANLALGKSYAYFGSTLPGQGGGHYQDDTHAGALGDFDTGELTDGILAYDTPGAPAVASRPGPSVGFHKSGQDGALGAAEAPPADIIFDLTTISTVDDIVIGTIQANGGNHAPDDVTISYSTTGIAPGDFGSAQLYDLETLFGPLAFPPPQHHDLPLAVGGISARYVKLAFDGGSMQNAVGFDPDEKWMLDEITINGDAGVIPEPSAFLLAALGLLGLLGWGRRNRRRAA